MIKVKKIVVVILFLCFSLSGCKDPPKEQGPHIASFIIVLGKFQSNGNEYWIKAYEPYNSSINEPFELQVATEKIWDSINVEKEYFAEYILYKDTRKGILMRYKEEPSKLEVQ